MLHERLIGAASAYMGVVLAAFLVCCLSAAAYAAFAAVRARRERRLWERRFR